MFEIFLHLIQTQIKREQALQRALRKLNKKSIFIESEYSDLYPKGSKIAGLYGTPKIHKSFSSGSIPPLRPIVSSIYTSNYKLTQYDGSLLSPHIPWNYATKDSSTFIEEIKQLNTYGKFLISFDVTSLFTNMPLEETINIDKMIKHLAWILKLKSNWLNWKRNKKKTEQT